MRSSPCFGAALRRPSPARWVRAPGGGSKSSPSSSSGCARARPARLLEPAPPTAATSSSSSSSLTAAPADAFAAAPPRRLEINTSNARSKGGYSYDRGCSEDKTDPPTLPAGYGHALVVVVVLLALRCLTLHSSPTLFNHRMTCLFDVRLNSRPIDATKGRLSRYRLRMRVGTGYSTTREYSKAKANNCAAVNADLAKLYLKCKDAPRKSLR